MPFFSVIKGIDDMNGEKSFYLVFMIACKFS